MMEANRGVDGSSEWPKVLVIGIDGGTFDLIEPWAREGKLPNFARMMEEGCWGTLQSVIPPITPPAWTSFMTGKNPGKHGLFHFIEPMPSSAYEFRYTNAKSRKGPTIWQILNAAGKRVGAINVPFTFPPEPVDGYMISGLDTPDENSSFIHPPSLKAELREVIGDYKLDVRYLGFMNTEDRQDQVLQELEEIDHQRTEATLYLMRRHQTDVVMLVFTATDTVQHYFWHHMEQEARYRDAIQKVYQRIDGKIGQLITQLPDDSSIIILSDHGAGPIPPVVVYLNRYLAQIGLLKFQGGAQGGLHPKKLLHLLVRKMDHLLRSNLTSRQKVKLARLLPGLRSKWESTYTFQGSIDWEHTQAYCSEILASPASIWINLKGKRPHGIVNPGEGYDTLLAFLIRKLYELKDPMTGKQLIKRVYRREEIYQGPYSDQAPDLTLAWWEGEGFHAKPSFVEDLDHPVVVPLAQSVKNGVEWSGNHRREGIVMLKGKPFKKGGLLTQAGICDLAPTMLYLMGVPVPDDMDGHILMEAFDEDFIHANAPVYQKAGSDDARDRRDETYTDEESQKVQERLRGLGYFE